MIQIEGKRELFFREMCLNQIAIIRNYIDGNLCMGNHTDPKWKKLKRDIENLKEWILQIESQIK